MKRIVFILFLSTALFLLSSCDKSNKEVIDVNAIDCTKQISSLEQRIANHNKKEISDGKYKPGVYYAQIYDEIEDEIKDSNGSNYADKYSLIIIIDNEGHILQEVYDYVTPITEVVDGKRVLVENKSFVLENDSTKLSFGSGTEEDVNNKKNELREIALSSASLSEEYQLYKDFTYGDYKPGIYEVELGLSYTNYNPSSREKLYVVVDNNGNLYQLFTIKVYSKLKEFIDGDNVNIPITLNVELDIESFEELVKNNGQLAEDLSLVSIYNYYWNGLVKKTEGLTTEEVLSKSVCKFKDNQDKINNLINQYGVLLGEIVETKYMPGVYHGVAYAREIDPSNKYIPYDSMYTASVVVGDNGSIAGVHYDRINIEHIENKESSERYYKLKSADLAVTNSKFDINNSYFKWRDNDLDGELSNNDTFIIQSGVMAQNILTYSKDQNNLVYMYGMIPIVYKNIVVDMDDQIYTTNKKVSSDFYNGIPVTNEEKMAEARFNALNGIKLVETPGPMFTIELKMKKVGDGAILPLGYTFNETKEKGIYAPGIYTSKIDSTHPNFVVGNQTYMVAIVDENNNIAGTFVNTLESSGFLRPNPISTESKDYDIIYHIKVDELHEALVSEHVVKGYYDGVYSGEAYDVYYEENELNMFRINGCVKFDNDFVCESGSRVFKFVYNSGEYEVYTQFSVRNEETDEISYFWKREINIKYNSHNLTTDKAKVSYYVPRIKLDDLNSNEFNRLILEEQVNFEDNESFKVLYDILTSIVLIDRD